MLPALIAAGGSIVGGLLQGNAAEKAKDAQIHGQMQAQQAAARAAERAEGIHSPFLQAGYGGLNALTARLGLPTQGVSSAINRAQTDVGTDWGAYGAANPDLQQAAQQAVGRGDYGSLNDFYRAHWQNGGQAEGRSLGNQPQSPVIDMQRQADGSYAAPNAMTAGATPGTFGNTADPTYTRPDPYQTPTYQEPGAYQTPTFDREYDAPEPFEFSVDSFKDNPAFKFAMEQGSGQVLSSATATGALQSGAALKRLQDRGQQTAYNFYAPERDAAFRQYTDSRDFGYGMYRDQRADFEDERDFGRGVYENDRNFGRDAYEDDRDFGRSVYDADRNHDRGIYESDRNYLTARFDRGTDDLFRLSGVGQSAAGTISNAAIGVGAANADSARGIAEAQAGNSLAQGSLWSGVAGDIAGTIAGAVRQNSLTADLRRAAAANPQLF